MYFTDVILWSIPLAVILLCMLMLAQRNGPLYIRPLMLEREIKMTNDF